MKKTLLLLGAFALVLATWLIGQAGAASRCVPNRRFVVQAGGLVKDTLTNLVWQQQASSTTMTWTAAQSYCPSGFRLPTVKELTSIVDLTVPYPGPTIDQTAFPSTPAEAFLTSTPAAGSAFYVYFGDGTLFRSDAGVYRVRCVR